MSLSCVPVYTTEFSTWYSGRWIFPISIFSNPTCRTRMPGNAEMVTQLFDIGCDDAQVFGQKGEPAQVAV